MLVLIADDDEAFRQELRRLLEQAGEVHVLEAANGVEALRLAYELQPEVVLMDIAMPGVDGLEATRRIKAGRPETKIIIVTVHDEEPYRRAARDSGVDGFLLKKTVVAELIPGIATLVSAFPAQDKGDRPYCEANGFGNK